MRTAIRVIGAIAGGVIGMLIFMSDTPSGLWFILALAAVWILWGISEKLTKIYDVLLEEHEEASQQRLGDDPLSDIDDADAQAIRQGRR